MEMKYSDRGTLVQRQRHPRPSRSLQSSPMNHCVQNTTSRRSMFEKLRNSEMIFLIIVSLKSGMENSIIQELNAEADRIISLFFFSCHLFPYLHKSCLISWQNLFMKHFKFVSWKSGGSAPAPRAGASPLDPTGAAPRTPAPPSACTPFPVQPTTRMAAIIKVTQAANFHVLIR